MAWIYSVLLFGPTLQDSIIQPGTWISMQTFDMISSMRQRISMLLSAAKQRGFKQEAVKDFRMYLNVLQKSGESRIRAAHGRWMLDDSEPNGVIWTPQIGALNEAEVYEPPDFEEELLAIRNASSKLMSFFVSSMQPTLQSTTEALRDAERRLSAQRPAVPKAGNGTGA